MAVLLHESAHYERGDVWKSLAARLLALPQWFNPFAWWAVWNFDEAAEWACDEAVRRAAPENTPAYGRALLLLGAGKAAHGMLNSAAQGRGLVLRIKRLLTTNLREDSIMKKTLVIAIGLTLLLAGGLRVRLVAREEAKRNQAQLSRAEDPLRAAAAKVDAARSMLDSAKKAHKIAMESYSKGLFPFSDVYPWSRRWLDAERALAESKNDQIAALMAPFRYAVLYNSTAESKNDQIAALTQHWKRMEELHLQVSRLVAGRQAAEFDEISAEYYVAEAESWLVAAGGTVPEKPE
ncbi:MAG TPA: M56 family metallopeptidase [Pirellulales bacterium]|nr:M56 family metallopeptidase [Pirellulales bacterium]